jgi:hypothetical protein
MAKRSSQKQNKHDIKVKKIAKKLKKEGWDVKADLKDFDRPDSIGKHGHIPDIQAQKAGATKLIEVETRDTLQKDKKQHEAFRKSAAQRNRTTFKIEIAD